MDAHSSFLIFYIATVLFGCFAEGLWGPRLRMTGYVSPALVGSLWPIGIVVGALVTPFAIALILGRLTARICWGADRHD